MRCGFDWCKKLFKNDEFLTKHIQNKHADHCKHCEDLCVKNKMKEAYVEDSARPLPMIELETGAFVDPLDIMHGRFVPLPATPHFPYPTLRVCLLQVSDNKFSLIILFGSFWV